ncbi:MAG: calcium-binding protein, partial [Acidimicrobiales bacterium]
DGTTDFSFDRGPFSKIVVKGGGGDDTLRIDRSNGEFTDTELTTLSGGDGNDTLIGDLGSETLDGGAGNDVLDGSRGNDVLVGGDGNDTVQWDPGDGSDTVEGGTGTDRLRFNGANVSEAFDVSANGGRVRMTRNVGAVVMDLDDVETLDLAELGGADVLTVGNLTGTDLTTITPDLAALGGGDDGQVDDVVVPAGTTIGQDGAAATATVPGAQVRVLDGSPTDRIHVTGTTTTDQVTLVGTTAADAVNATADGTDVAVFGATPGVHVELTTVPTLDIELGGGDDTFSATGNLAPLVTMHVDGDYGHDTLLGGNGADVLDGGADDDFLDGNQGNDVLVGGDGNDTIQWDPGDGSDTVEGGTGTDRLAFNGSNISEVLDVSANGGRVRLARNVGAVVMDLDDVETLDLAELGGADTLTVNDLTGTDLTAVNVNLAVFGGAADGSSDEVIVNGTPGNDTVTIAGVGTTVETRGLAATVRVTGADPTLDRLTVNGLAGADTITPTAEAAALMLLNLVP